MGPLQIVNLHKAIEALLLLQEVVGGRLRRIILQCQVHPFMTPVLFGVAWLDALNTNTEAKPPNGKAGEAKERISRTEGRSLVGTHG